jgi:methionine-rich copper-binding protein CopC
MKILKKITAITIIASIVLASTITSAANTAINSSTAAAGVAGAIGDTITVTNTGEFPDGDEIATATITLLDGTAAGITTLSADGDNADNDTTTVTVAGANLVNNTAYIVSFTTTSGDYGVAQLNIGTPTNDVLTVSANVQPVLKFALQSTSQDFGTLTSVYAGVTTGLEVGTNAINGVTITASSTNGGLNSATASHIINGDATDADGSLYDAEGYQFEATVGTHDSTGTATISGLVADDVDISTPGTTNVKTIYSADKPQNFDTA